MHRRNSICERRHSVFFLLCFLSSWFQLGVYLLLPSNCPRNTNGPNTPGWHSVQPIILSSLQPTAALPGWNNEIPAAAETGNRSLRPRAARCWRPSNTTATFIFRGITASPGMRQRPPASAPGCRSRCRRTARGWPRWTTTITSLRLCTGSCLTSCSG
jgi:hypothetical protein